MKAIVQRCRGQTSIRIGEQCERGFLGPGLVVLLGWMGIDESRDDLDQAEDWLLARILGLRIFPDVEGKMNVSLSNFAAGTSCGILWVSQFPLSAELESGFRPSFSSSMKADLAAARYARFCEKVIQETKVITHATQVFGEFGADMALSFTNWGPVTIPLSR